MKIITYLAFTMLSVAIQFVVMDFIQNQINFDSNKTMGRIDLNNTSPKRNFSDILRQYAPKPHALYYAAQNSKLLDTTKIAKTYMNLSIGKLELNSLETSTDFTSTLIDLFYDDNITVTDSFTTVTESIYTSTEFDVDNVTEITFFEKKNKTEVKPMTKPKKVASKDCSCNLLYKVCDINCCCDDECTESDLKIFQCDESSSKQGQSNICYSHISFLMGSNINDLFCVVKNNLPDKRKVVHNKHDSSTIDKHFKWRFKSKLNSVKEFTKKHYQYGDPIWLLRNSTIYYFDLPTTMINNYCSARKPIRFLKNEKIKCIVKLTDLEIFQILSTAEETSVISVTEKSMNASGLNCSALHCTKWKINVCKDLTCTEYNKSLHDPMCTDSICTDLALKVAYIFHYHENKIINATIKLYIQKVPLNMPFIEQEVNVKFLIANVSIDDIVEYSGNPGYVVALPVIVSSSKSNYTEGFFNNSSKLKKYLLYPENINGICSRLNNTDHIVSFGINKRIKCRFVYEQKAPIRNETNTCRNIQKKINNLLYLDQNVVISPLGNPNGLTDEDWLTVVSATTNTPENLIYGELNNKKTKLYCYNMMTRLSMVLTFADVSNKSTGNELKVLSAKIVAVANNVTFNVGDISTVLTVDTIFIDETKPNVYEYAGGPHLHIDLPRDFFFPNSYNLADGFTNSNMLMLFLLLLVK